MPESPGNGVAASPPQPNPADTRKPSAAREQLHFDDALVNELGQFGRYQFKSILLITIPIMMSAFTSEYIFSAAAIPHRCQIPECGETNKSVEFQPEWILNAIPATSFGFESCERFAAVGSNGTLDYCPLSLFDQSNVVECNGFVYSRNNSVVYDFDLGCQEWLRSLAGALNSAGTLTVMPLVGFISDRFGRKVMMMISVFNMALLGLVRAFSVNYYMYLALQFLQTMMSAGIFSSSYILAIELVGPKYRVMSSAVASSMFAVGQIVLASIAWLIQPWQYMIAALSIPCFLIVSYYWLLEESVRWQLSRQKYDRAKPGLEKMARVNKKKLSDKTLYALVNPPPSSIPTIYSRWGLLKATFRSRVLLRRVLTVPMWWVAATFMYYGLSIDTISLSDNLYLNYILIYAIEIPGYVTAMLVLDRIGRKPTLSCGFFLSAVCNFTFAFVDERRVRLALFVVGKFSVSVVLTTVYLLTIELYPTAYRHTFLAYSSMIGRVGTVIVPFTPLMMEHWEGIPYTVFGCLGLAAGVLVLTQPETRGWRLPDSLEESEHIGRR